MGLASVPPKEPALQTPAMNMHGDKAVEEVKEMVNGAATSSPAKPAVPAPSKAGAAADSAASQKYVSFSSEQNTAQTAPPATYSKQLSTAKPALVVPQSEPSAQRPAGAANQAKSALKAVKDATSGAVSDAVAMASKVREGGAINVTPEHITWLCFGVFILSSLFIVRMLRPSPLIVAIFTVLGVGLGMGLSFMYYKNKQVKEEIRSILGAKLGLKGLQTLLGTLPSWLSFTEREKMEWVNGLLEEVWPYVDRGVCKMVKSQTETLFADMLKQMTVPGLKSITFKHLTFGDAPFRVESIKVKEDFSQFVEMEVAIRWCGDANITMAIELAGIAGSNKLCPRVTDISFTSLARVRLCPLVDMIPGFGAMSVTFDKPPRYNYQMNFGAALGGATAASIVQPFVNSVANEVIQNMMVWPQRLVVPLYWNDPVINLEVEKMSYRSQGVMKVTVVRATDLKSADIGGRSDPVVNLTTDGRHVPETRVIPKSLHPEWNQTFWLVVHEPTSQSMKVWVSDVDFFSPKDLVTLNLSNTIGSKEVIGKTLVDLAPITAEEGNPVDQWYHLGDGDWSRPEGCGKGMGKIQLNCLYRSFGHLRPEEVQTADKGILNIRIRKVQKMNRQMSIAVAVKVGNEKFVAGPVTNYKGGDHLFYFGNVKDFYGVKYDEDVKLTIYERSLAGDDVVGVVEMPVTDVAMAVDNNVLTGLKEAGFFDRTLKLEDADTGQIHVQLRYIPYFASAN